MFRKDSGIELFQAKEVGSFTILSKLIFSQDRENFAGEPFFVLENFWNEKSSIDKKGVISRFSGDKFRSHSAKKFDGHHFNVSEILGYRKILCIIGGITFFQREFLISQCRKISWASLQCFRKFGVSKNFMHNRGYHDFSFKFFVPQYQKVTLGNTSVHHKNSGIEIFMHKKGISLNSVENSLSHCADKIRRRTFLRFERILVSNFFKQRRGGGKLHDFVKIYFLTGLGKLRRGTIRCVRKFLEWKIFFTKKGLYHDFPAKKFLSDCTKMFRWRTLWCFREILWSKIFINRRRGHHGFAELFFVSQDRNEKLCKGTLLFSRNFLVLKEIYG